MEGHNTYEYDAIENLTQMNENGSIQQLWWNVYGKVSRVEKDGLTMSFGYDAQQNRLKKMVERAAKDQINYYLRDAQGNVLTVYRKTKRRDINKEFFLLEEQTLYGSSRLGVRREVRSLRGVVTQDPMSNEVIAAYEQWGEYYWTRLSEKYETDLGKILYERWGDEWEYRLKKLLEGSNDESWLVERVSQEVLTVEIGLKDYELSNHLGNVLAVVSDKKEQLNGVWQAIVLSAKDYYPFGMSMPGRGTEGGTYRYGFNGKETDPETELNDFGARFYATNLGRWLSIDPLAAKFPNWLPYNAMNDNPMFFIDPNGMEVINGDKILQNRAKLKMEQLNKNFEEKYKGNRELSKKDFEGSKISYKDYKKDLKSLHEAEDKFKKAYESYLRTEERIQDLKDTYPDFFKMIDNLTYQTLEGNHILDVIVYDKRNLPEDGQTSFLVVKESGIIRIYEDGAIVHTLRVDIKYNAKPDALAHEFGHAEDAVYDERGNPRSP